jgi:predicted secreted protein
MDKAVAAAYGWGRAVDSGQLSVGSEEPLELGHDFHETAQGVRFTVSESARREILSRLLKLNHERYEEEQKAGVKEESGKKKEKKVKKVKSNAGQMGLL